jgi:hypothetical protein
VAEAIIAAAIVEPGAGDDIASETFAATYLVSVQELAGALERIAAAKGYVLGEAFAQLKSPNRTLAFGLQSPLRALRLSSPARPASLVSPQRD